MVVEDKPPAEGEAPAPAPGELRSIHASLDGVNNHNVMLFDLNSCSLENFEFHYNKYCQKEDLKPFLKEELQAELASRFDCKFKRVRMPQISGLKWKDCTLHDLDAFRERKLRMRNLEEFGDIGGAASLNIDREMIARFLREECQVTGHNQIDQIQTFDRRRRDEDGASRRPLNRLPTRRRRDGAWVSRRSISTPSTRRRVDVVAEWVSHRSIQCTRLRGRRRAHRPCASPSRSPRRPQGHRRRLIFEILRLDLRSESSSTVSVGR
jgi:hypothetical protein